MPPRKTTGTEIDNTAPAATLEGEVLRPAGQVADPLTDPAYWPPEPQEEALPGDMALEDALNAVDSMKQWLGMRYRVWKMGSKYNPTERDRLIVLHMTWAGFPKERIARYIGMNKETMLNYFAYELEHGRDGMVTDVVKAVVLKAKGGDLTAAKMILTNRAADLWDDKRGVPQVNVSVTEEKREAAPDPERLSKALDLVAQRVIEKLGKPE